jgi:hypothetical protein
LGNLGCGVVALFLISGAIITWAFQSWQSALVTLAIVAMATWAIIAGRRASKQTQITALLAMADKLETISKEMMPIESQTGFVPKAAEKLYFELQPVGLTEYRSSGSTYSGTSQSVSIPVYKGIRYSVGSHSGSVQKNPEALTVIDTGKAIFTNQRILFVGPNMSREWDLSKVIDIQEGPNGQTVAIAVSNRQKVSGLSSIGRENITPGIYVAITHALATGSVTAAKKTALEYAAGIRDVIAEEAKERGEQKL